MILPGTAPGPQRGLCPPTSALVRPRLGVVPGNPQGRGQSQGEPEVAAQRELPRDQQSPRAGSAADQAQECHWLKLERQRRSTSVTSRCLAPAVAERELVAVDVAVPAAGDSELHHRVDPGIGLCALTDRTKDLPQQNAAKPAAHDRLESFVRSRAHPPSKPLGLEISKPALASAARPVTCSAGQRVHSLRWGKTNTEG